jgi:AmpE protein
MKLLALIIAYLICHTIPKPHRFRNFQWYQNWMNWFNQSTKFKIKEITLILSIAIPVLVISLILNGLVFSSMGGLFISVFVLCYCIGPKSIEEDVESKEIHKRLGLRKNAKVPVLIKTMTQVSMHRWFGVFFWYLILGITGTILYRLAERHNYYVVNNKDSEKDDNEAVSKLMKILNYPVAWVMVISLAIASDFERIFKKCKPFMNLDNVKNMDDTFLYEAADFAVEICEVEENDEKSIEDVTIEVLKRMLVVWLVFVSILVIFAN